MKCFILNVLFMGEFKRVMRDRVIIDGYSAVVFDNKVGNKL